jgi:hypothetical protein
LIEGLVSGEGKRGSTWRLGRPGKLFVELHDTLARFPSVDGFYQQYDSGFVEEENLKDLRCLMHVGLRNQVICAKSNEQAFFVKLVKVKFSFVKTLRWQMWSPHTLRLTVPALTMIITGDRRWGKPKVPIRGLSIMGAYVDDAAVP